MHVTRFLGVGRILAACVLTVTSLMSPAGAERQIVDLHRLDADFALFAADSSVPWKPATVRLDTYSNAPMTFTVYQIDPTDVLTAGANFDSRAIATTRRRAIGQFIFTPSGGYQFQSNVVNVPLGTREGFFVVEARRGNVAEQVWINRTRIGLISKQTPSGLVLYGADLASGTPLSRMRLQFVVARRFVPVYTNAQGIVLWNPFPRPVFALAQWGNSYAFLSPLPQPPLPNTIVGLRTDSAVAHAGGIIRVAGFARTGARGILRASWGSALVALRYGSTTVAQRRVALDTAGAFTTSFPLSENAPAGEYAVLAQASGGVGGATVDVDATAAGLWLTVTAACNDRCDPHANVPLVVHSSRPDTTVHVVVVRSPHIDVGEAPENAPWAATKWLDATVRTDDGGKATVEIPHPNDELGSTYGVHAQAGGATADTRVTVPTADAAIRVIAGHSVQSIGTPLNFDVYAASLDAKPLVGATATIDLIHGVSALRQRLTLDADGHARGSFTEPELGTNLLVASVDHAGLAVDAAAIRVDPQIVAPSSDGASANVRIRLDRPIYRAGDEISVDAAAMGAKGVALLTFESALGIQTRIVRANGGHAVARFRAVDAAGELRVGAVFVRDGALQWNTAPIALVAPGRPRTAHFSIDSAQYAAGSTAKIAFDRDSVGSGTFIVRISRDAPSGSAVFGTAPALLAVGVTTTQCSASDVVRWHPWVRASGDRAQVLGFLPRTQPPPDVSLAQADTQAVAWLVVRADGAGISVSLPEQRGRYDLSVLAIADDGSVSAGFSTIVVR